MIEYEYIIAVKGTKLPPGAGNDAIVRCRDCAKYVTTWPGREPDWCVEFKRRTKLHEYCAWGERKDDA